MVFLKALSEDCCYFYCILMIYQIAFQIVKLGSMPMYAHQAYPGHSADNIQSCLNDDLVNVSNWLIANKLTLTHCNMTKTYAYWVKTETVYFNSFPRPSINGAPIEQVTTAKSLGVLIDNGLTWWNHIDNLTKKISSGIGAVKRIRHLVSYGTLHSIYQALHV